MLRVNNQNLNMSAPSLLKLGACLLYELLTIIALIFVSAGLFILIAGDATHGIKRLLLQLFLWLTIGAYFIRCWLKSGQTLAMQAWKLRLVDDENQSLTLTIAIIRYLLATLSLVFCGVGFLWAIVDRKNLFLHDRILQSKIITESK
jgi:uncharacterized RDD family membrane protein YckC